MRQNVHVTKHSFLSTKPRTHLLFHPCPRSVLGTHVSSRKNIVTDWSSSSEDCVRVRVCDGLEIRFFSKSYLCDMHWYNFIFWFEQTDSQTINNDLKNTFEYFSLRISFYNQLTPVEPFSTLFRVIYIFFYHFKSPLFLNVNNLFITP